MSEENSTTTKPPATVETVVMKEDGRKVEFAGKRKMVKESFLTDDGQIIVRFDFRNGESRTYKPADGMLKKLASHGAEQKIGDETAGVEDVDDMVIAVENIIKRLDNNEWNVKREGSGVAGTSVLVRALAELYNKPVDVIKAFLQDKSQAEKLALRAHPSVKPIIDKIEAEKAAKSAKVDTAGIFAGLEALPAAG